MQRVSVLALHSVHIGQMFSGDEKLKQIGADGPTGDVNAEGFGSEKLFAWSASSYAAPRLGDDAQNES